MALRQKEPGLCDGHAAKPRHEAGTTTRPRCQAAQSLPAAALPCRIKASNVQFVPCPPLEAENDLSPSAHGAAECVRL